MSKQTLVQAIPIKKPTVLTLEIYANLDQIKREKQKPWIKQEPHTAEKKISTQGKLVC